jgi:hypothetical protein
MIPSSCDGEKAASGADMSARKKFSQEMHVYGETGSANCC